MKLLYNALLIIGILTKASCIQAMEEKPQWLILGAGNSPDDIVGWTSYSEKKGAEWIGFTNQPLRKAIEGDFNELDQLENKLSDNTYDKIFFDWSTVKFVHYWDIKILEVLRRKLKDNGELLIRFDGLMAQGGNRAVKIV